MGYTTKSKLNLSINKEIHKLFNKVAKEKCINKSQLIELYIKNWIKENDK